MEGVTAAQEEEGIAWIANVMAAVEHEYAHAYLHLPVRTDMGCDVVLSSQAPPVEPRPFANRTPVLPAADFKGVCIWCWEHGHESKKCKEKQSPEPQNSAFGAHIVRI